MRRDTMKEKLNIRIVKDSEEAGRFRIYDGDELVYRGAKEGPGWKERAAAIAVGYATGKEKYHND